MNKLIDRIMKVPLATRIGVVLGAVALVTAANWFLVIDGLEEQIVDNEQTIARLNKDLVEKRVIADNLNQYRHDKEILERRLAEALTQLPASRDIDELLRQLNDVGKKSGLEIVSIEPGNETPSGFYASIPIKMSVAGNYHEIAVFFESVSKLRRIVNVSRISLGSPDTKSEKVILKANYLATTFRFLETNQQATQPRK